MSEKSILIIGAGVAGLSAGCYARMNGYDTQIFEMHDKPGGLCTAWKRKGYTIDGCIHWLVGSGPGSDFHRFWQEVGAIQGRQILNMEQFMRFEDADSRTFTIYTDINRLEQHMKEISPEDTGLIGEFISGIRAFMRFEMPSNKAPELYNLWDILKLTFKMLPHWRKLPKWVSISMQDFADRFKNPLLREALLSIWPPEFPTMFVMMTIAWMHMKTAGYPIGGSLPFVQAIEKRYLDLGGKISYKSRATKILVENNRAVGIKLADGTECYADYIISAADGHTTIFEMLEGKYTNDKIYGYFDRLPTFTPLIFVGFGVNRSFDDFPKIISGIDFPLSKPITFAGTEYKRLSVRIHNFDTTLAPAGKTVITIMLPTNYDVWEKLNGDTNRYYAEKKQIVNILADLLDKRFPGFKSQIEVQDVATPITFHRYTGNWKGSFEGWMVTPKTWNLRMSKTLPGLDNFYMAGQWVEPGGGLPPSVMSGRNTIQIICKRDKNQFVTTVPDLPLTKVGNQR